MPHYERFLKLGFAPYSSSVRDKVRPSSLEIGEYRRMYDGSYCYVEDKLHMIAGVVEVRGYDGMCFVVRPHKGSSDALYIVAENKCDYRIPEYGFVNINGFATLLSTDSRRRWRLGINTGNLTSYTIGSEFINMLWISSATPYPLSYRSNGQASQILEVLKRVNVTKPTYPTFSSSLSRVLTGDVFSCAFTKDLALLASPSGVGAIIYYRLNPIGKIDEKGSITLDANYQWVLEVIGDSK